jgi:hypothetical protein
MKKITDIYREYKLMPTLALHQLRVASVAAQICDSLDITVDKESVISACLLHDMGNIIKFKLDYFPEFLKPEGLEYWQKIKEEYKEKYGPDEHIATLEIAKELHTSETVLNLINSIGFSHSVETSNDNHFEIKICCYADMRVNPFGIVALEERLADVRERYERNKSVDREHVTNTDDRIIFENSQQEIEKQIFAHSKITPEDINDKSTTSYIEELKNFSLS